MLTMGETQQQTMATSSNGLTFELYPLVIVNISDHHTRVKAQSQSQPHTCHQQDNTSSSSSSASSNNKVFRCVMGVQRVRTVEIYNSFELLYDPVTNSLDWALIFIPVNSLVRFPPNLGQNHRNSTNVFQVLITYLFWGPTFASGTIVGSSQVRAGGKTYAFVGDFESDNLIKEVDKLKSKLYE